MKVILPKTTYSQYLKIKEQNLKRTNLPKNLKESILYNTKRLFILVICILYAYGIITTYSIPAYKKAHVFTLDALKIKPATSPLVSYIIEYGYPIIVGVSILCIAFIFAFKVINTFFSITDLYLSKEVSHEKEKQIKLFIKEIKKLEDFLIIAKEIDKMSNDDISNSEIIVKNKSNKITLILKNTKYRLTKNLTLSIRNKSIIKTLKTSGVLDLSFIDKEWDDLLKKYEIT